MDGPNFHFPSDTRNPGYPTPPSSISSRKSGNGSPLPPPATSSIGLHPSSAGYNLLNALYARRGQLPDRNRASQNASMTPSATDSLSSSVRLGAKTYTFVREIEPPSGGVEAMSDGVRILRTSAGILVIEKRLNMTKRSSKDRARAEVRALEQIKGAGGSPHINHLIEALYTPGDSHSSLVLEFCDRGSLRDIINNCRRTGDAVAEDFCWHILMQLSCALALCHNGVRDPFNAGRRPQEWNTLCHVDIKPANVFVSSRKAPGFEKVQWPTVVLGDFGCAVTKEDIRKGKFNQETMPYGTEGWFPPEAKDRLFYGDDFGSYGRQTDIWQLGGLILVMCHQLEYPDVHLLASDLPCGSKYSQSLSRAVGSCMAKELEVRPTAVDVAIRVRKMASQARRDATHPS